MSASKPSSAITWSLLLICMLGPTAAAAVYAVADVQSHVARFTYFSSKAILALIPAVWLLVVAKTRLRIPRPRWSGIGWGAGFGLLAAVLILIIYYYALANRLDTHAVRQKAADLGVLNYFGGFAVFLCFFNSAYEEYYWRWFVFGQLRQSIAMPGAALISALTFGLHHGVIIQAYFHSMALTGLMTFGVIVGGVVWAVLYDRSKNLYSPWISHVLIDAAIMIAAYDLLIVR